VSGQKDKKLKPEHCKVQGAGEGKHGAWSMEKYSWQGADGSRQKLEVRDQTSEVRGKADL
jgi:hypothetical protein